ncbi:MAG: LytTR family DNA-binding domain-containing protein [bacterium]
MNTLLVDDEMLARKRIRRLLADHTDVTIVGECNSGRTAIDAVRTHRVDLMLLDVQMSGMDGFGVLRALAPEEAPLVVFVTAFDSHAIRAFEVAAVDYLVKPVRKERLAAALDRVRAVLESRESAAVGKRLQRMLVEFGGEAPSALAEAAATRAGADRIEVQDGDKVVFIATRDVDYIEADGPLVKIHSSRGQFKIRETLAHMESSLNAKQFVRIHRSFIVNIARVSELQPWFGGDAILVLTGGQKLKVSRTYRGQLKERLNAI